MNRTTWLLKVYCPIVIIFFASSFTLFAQEVWQWVNPLPQGNTLFDVHIFDANTAIAVGDAGTIMKTTNGGNNWSILHHVCGITTALRSVAFIDSAMGIVVGDFGSILSTIDGGITWTKLDNVTKNSLFGICVLTRDIWLAVSSEATVLRSDDGGVTWREQATEAAFYRITAINTLSAIAVGGVGSIMKTADGGISWSYQHYLCGIIDGSLKDVDFIDASHGIAVGSYEYSYILRTEDGGTNWSRYPIRMRYILRGVAGVNSNSCIAVGDGGAMLRSDDGGMSWGYSAYYSAPNNLYSIQSLKNNTAMSVGLGGIILSTTNGGVNWKSLSSGTTKNWTDVFFVNHKIGMAVGIDGTILRTEDAGTTWQDQSYDTLESLGGVHFISADTGTVVGTHGLILHTIDGGDRWEIQLSGTMVDLRDVHFTDANTGTVVGQSGIILRTTDGGNSWVKQTSGTTASLEGVFFTAKDTGIVVGAEKTILFTVDGGKTWLRQFIEMNTYFLEDVHFSDSLNGFIVGKGIILKSVDGGLNWFITSDDSMSSLCPLRSVSFLNKNIGAVAGGGTILWTTDGGQTWIRQAQPTNNFLTGVAVLDTNTAIVVGSYGTILRIAAPPISSVKENLLPKPENLLKRVVLQQNYPNPFNSSTTIPFSLFEPAFVSLKIFNISGELVSTLLAKTLQAGNYSMQWKLNSEPSGVYFYQITIMPIQQRQKLTESRKLLIIK